MCSAAVLIQSLDVVVEPDILALDGADALALQADALDDILGDQIAPGGLALDCEGGEVVVQHGLL